MKIAISNLAWNRDEDEQVLAILHKHNISGIELATTKVWESPTTTSQEELALYKNWWKENGIEVVATTSLLFGHPELTIFENDQATLKTLDYLTETMRVSSTLGASAMVFGSPKNRQRFGKGGEETEKIAVEFFYKVGEAAEKYAVYFGIEPNPEFYGTDFVNNTNEAINLVTKVNHPQFRIHFDSGAMEMNKEDYQEVITSALPYTCHFHISEPQLKPVPTGDVDHKKVAEILRRLNYDKWVSVEMPLGQDVDHCAQIEKTLQFVTHIYGDR